MTLNWGHKLLFVFIVFAALMSFLVYSSVKTNFDLVSKEYYKEEIAYQQVIEGTKRANLLSSAVSLVRQNDSILVRFPREMHSAQVKGTIWFYYPPDAKRDRKFPFSSMATGELAISRLHFLPGNYTVRIRWEKDTHQYYTEQLFTIQK